MDTDFCVEALEEALDRYGLSEVSDTDQGAQFTANTFADVFKALDVAISMGRKGRWVDNMLIERLWRSVKYEDVYLCADEAPADLPAGLARYLEF